MFRPRILIDMDGVLADFSGAINDEVARLGGAPLPTDRQGHFELEDLYPDHAPSLREAIRRQGFYGNLAPIDGAIEGVNRLREADLDVWICTAPVRSPFCGGEKIDWIGRYWDRDLAARTVVTKDKTVVRGDVLIDDKPEVTGADQPSWVHLVFDQPYNRHVEGLRLPGWHSEALLDRVVRAAEHAPARLVA